jgi:hypothetical protein
MILRPAHLDNAVAFQAREIGLERTAGRGHSHAIGEVGAIHAAGMSGHKGVNHLGRPGSQCGFPLMDDGAWLGAVDRAAGGEACRVTPMVAPFSSI